MEKLIADLTDQTVSDIIHICTHTLYNCVAEQNTKNWQLSMTIKNKYFPN